MKKFLIGLFALLLPSFALAAYNGIPTPKANFKKDGDCYLIKTAEDLYGFAALVNGTDEITATPAACGILTANIVVNGSETETLTSMLNEDGSVKSGKTVQTWTPIGTSDKNYEGSFNGNGFAVKGLYFNNTEQSNVGLFGYIGSKGKIDRVGVEDSYFKGWSYVGGVAGSNYGSITNSFNAASIFAVDNKKVAVAGGIAGINNGGGSVTNCYNSGSVSKGTNIGSIGGIVGINEGSVTNCYNVGFVDESGDYTDTVGSIVGWNYGSVTDCFALEGSAEKLAGKLSPSAVTSSGFKTEDEFQDGSVAILLHDWCELNETKDGCKAGGKNGSTWGQYVGTGAGRDAYPVLGNGENGTGIVKFDIEYVLNGGTKAEDAPKTYAYGKGASLKDPTRAGYTFKGWFTSVDFEGEIVTSIAADATGVKTFYAKWSNPIPYTISYKNENGAANTNPTSYTVETEEKDLLPLTRDGYKFQGWFDGEGDDAIEVKKVAGGKVGDIILYASWSIEFYKITAVANDASMGSVSGAGTYEYGAEVSLVATAAEFYHFTNWQDDADAKATRKVTVAVGGASYVANFAADVYKVTLNANGGTVASELKEYTYGEGATLPLATKDGYIFAGWFAGSDADAKEVKAISGTDHGNMEFFAKWNAEQSSSSSVETGSSSSALPSDAQESSSSVNFASSSSAKSSSSNKTEHVVVAAQLPQFRTTVLNREVQISGARIGSIFAILDMQGRVITTGAVFAANFAVEMPGAGSYMIRVGNQLQRVNVK